jgi:hypothetical protein
MCRPLTEAEISAIVEAGGGRYIGVLGEIPEKTESITDQRDCGDSGAAHVAEGLSGKAAIILAERGASQPEAVVAWTYPGRVEGHQFLYPRPVQEEVAKDKQDTFVFGD